MLLTENEQLKHISAPLGGMRHHGQLCATYTIGDIRQFSTGTVDQSPMALREDQPSEFASRDQLDLWSSLQK